jgi:glutathione S-transferase
VTDLRGVVVVRRPADGHHLAGGEAEVASGLSALAGTLAGARIEAGFVVVVTRDLGEAVRAALRSVAVPGVAAAVGTGAVAWAQGSPVGDVVVRTRRLADLARVGEVHVLDATAVDLPDGVGVFEAPRALAEAAGGRVTTLRDYRGDVPTERVPDAVELHGREGCPFAWRARLAAAEKGVSAAWIVFDRDPPDPGHERNPDHKSPLLVHGAFSLPESMVIAAYLDEAFAGPLLSPPDPVGRARMRLAMATLDALTADTRPGTTLSEPARARVDSGLRFLDEQLADRDWLGGAAPSLADLQIWPMLAGLFLRLHLPVPPGCVATYWGRVTTRPSWLATRPPWAA